MVRVTLVTNEIRPSGELVDHIAVTFDVDGHELTVVEGDPRYIQVGLPVYSERYGRLIDFSEDGEEWARNLGRAYQNGALAVSVEELAPQPEVVGGRAKRLP